MLNSQNQNCKTRLPPLALKSLHWGKDLDKMQDAIRDNIINVNVTTLTNQAHLMEGYLSHADTDDLEISFLRYGANVKVEGLHDDTYAMVIPLKGRLSIKHNHPPCHNDLLHIIPPFVDLNMAFSPDCEQLVLRFKKTSFHEAIFSPILANRFSKQQHHFALIVRENCEFFLAECNYATEQESITALIKDLQQCIYDTLLQTNNFATHTRRLNKNSPAWHALQFIDEHPNWNYNIEELASFFEVSTRTLYSQFQSQVHTSPYRYYQNRKLCCTRLGLLRYGKRFNITEIASYNGFEHLGRFSSQYKALFGELPSSTLDHGQRTL